MAYSPTESAAVKVGSNLYRVSFTTADGGAATETEMTGLPTNGRIMRVKSSQTSGSGTTRTPVIGTATAPSGTTIAYQADATAVATVVDDVPDGGAPYHSSSGSLYYRSVYDAGSDNVTVVEVLIAAGWA